MKKLSQIIETIGMKKFCLFVHYAIAIGASMIFFAVGMIFTISPVEINITGLLEIYKLVLIYCAVVVGYITVLCVMESMQTMNKKNTKFDWVAFYIGFSMFVTLGLIVLCAVRLYLLTNTVTDIEANLWKFLISIFGGMFMMEAGGGYIYQSVKKVIGKEKGNPDEQDIPQ